MQSNLLRRPLPFFIAGLMSVLMTTVCNAQTRVLTADDYARAEQFLGYKTSPLVVRSGVRPAWLPDGRFWYRITTETGSEFILVDPARAMRGPAFDHKTGGGAIYRSRREVRSLAAPLSADRFFTERENHHV